MNSSIAGTSIFLCLITALRTQGQCTVAIPNDAVIFTTAVTTTISNGSAWVCNGGLFDGAALYTSLFVESGGSLDMSGVNKKAYLKSGAYMNCSGIGDTIWYEAGAIIACSGDHVDILCDEIIFDYTNAPTGGCVSTGLSRVRGGHGGFILSIDQAAEKLTLRSSAPWPEKASVTIFDPTGKVISSARPTATPFVSDITALPPGVYVLRVMVEGTSTALRFVAE